MRPPRLTPLAPAQDPSNVPSTAEPPGAAGEERSALSKEQAVPSGGAQPFLGRGKSVWCVPRGLRLMPPARSPSVSPLRVSRVLGASSRAARGPSTEPEPQPQQRPARSRRMSASSQGGVSSGAALLHTPARGAAPRGKRQEGRSAGAVPGGADLRAKSVCCSWPSGPVRAGAGSSAERVLDFFYTWGCFGPPARYLCQHPLNCCFSQFLLRFFAF